MAMSGVAMAASDAIADLIAQSPGGRVTESKFKGLSDVALIEARRAGCSYAANTSACDTGDACVDARCSNGECKAKGKKDCDDRNVCTADRCDSNDGCVHAPAAASCRSL